MGGGKLADAETNIPKSKAMGADSIFLLTYPKDIDNARRGPETDMILKGIVLAHENGMAAIITLDRSKWSNNMKSKFFTDADARTQYINDFQYVLDTYPTLDGILVEEPTAEAVAPKDSELRAMYLTFNNQFFSELDTLVKEKNEPDFWFGFSTGTNGDDGLLGVGLDMEYFRNQNLWNGYFISAGGADVAQYNVLKTNWDKRLPGRYEVTAVFLQYTSLLRSPDCVAYQDWHCWNQNFWRLFRYTNANNIPLMIFDLSKTSASEVYWPADQSGETWSSNEKTSGDKIKAILSGISPPSTVLPTVLSAISLTPTLTSTLPPIHQNYSLYTNIGIVVILGGIYFLIMKYGKKKVK